MELRSCGHGSRELCYKRGPIRLRGVWVELELCIGTTIARLNYLRIARSQIHLLLPHDLSLLPFDGAIYFNKETKNNKQAALLLSFHVVVGLTLKINSMSLLNGANTDLSCDLLFTGNLQSGCTEASS